MSCIHKLLFYLLMFMLCLQLCSCKGGVTDISNEASANTELFDESDSQPTSNVTSDAKEDSAENEESVKNTYNVIMTTDKTKYGFDDTVICKIRSEDENEYFSFKNGPDFAFVQYWDSGTNKWTVCEKEYTPKEIGLEGSRNTYALSFVLSERTDEGKEKYRIGMEFDRGTFYSNEFTVTK